MMKTEFRFVIFCHLSYLYSSEIFESGKMGGLDVLGEGSKRVRVKLGNIMQVGLTYKHLFVQFFFNILIYITYEYLITKTKLFVGKSSFNQYIHCKNTSRKE